MPTLPTLTVNDQAIWNRLLAAFNGSQTEYKAWLKESVVAEVKRREISALAAQQQAALDAKAAETNGLLDSAT